MSRSIGSILWRGGLIAVGAVACPLHAASDRYDYDPLGRLIRRVDDQSRSTDYVYDAAGNVLQVSTGGASQPLSITSGPIGDQRRNEIRQISLSGTGLGGVSIRTSHPGIVVSQVAQSATGIGFRLSVSGLVPLGAQELIIEGATGSARLPFNVLQAISFVITPQPINLAPDGTVRKVSLVALEPLTASTTFSVATQSSAIAKSNVAQVTLAAGQSQADFGLIGVAEGTTVLRLSQANRVEPLEYLVFVSSQRFVQGSGVAVTRGLPIYVSPNSLTNSNAIGLVRDRPWRASPTVNPLVAPLVGVSRP